MMFRIEESEYDDTYLLLDKDGKIVDEFESGYDAEVWCEILNDTYGEGFEAGKEYVLNGEV